ncbi:hypothetical protein B296_00054691 [Ensete ventricosum]|uniref:Uncharacterized protein n=1 Tax=Ensete ventricosum TaxID=4639 RepID=A0A426XQC0_ENSVE|nr:hypothetical protein B296_00054691 [Ensete ventricosum]
MVDEIRNSNIIGLMVAEIHNSGTTGRMVVKICNSGTIGLMVTEICNLGTIGLIVAEIHNSRTTRLMVVEICNSGTMRLMVAEIRNSGTTRFMVAKIRNSGTTGLMVAEIRNSGTTGLMVAEIRNSGTMGLMVDEIHLCMTRICGSKGLGAKGSSSVEVVPSASSEGTRSEGPEASVLGSSSSRIRSQVDAKSQRDLEVMKSCHDVVSIVGEEALGPIRECYSIPEEYVLRPYNVESSEISISVDALEVSTTVKWFSLCIVSGTVVGDVSTSD